MCMKDKSDNNQDTSKEIQGGGDLSSQISRFNINSY